MADKSAPLGNYFEDFEVGDIFNHFPSKTIIESECHLFSLLTMNHHPLHIDKVHAAHSQHGQILVPGTLTFSLAAGLSVRDISMLAIANLGYTDIVHHLPVFVNDTIRASSTVLRVRSCRKPDRGIVRVGTSAFNQANAEVLSFTREVLIPRRI